MKNSKIIVGGLFVISLEGLATVTLHVYRVSRFIWNNTRVQIKRTKLSQQVFAVVNELLTIKNRVSPAYRLIQARDEMRPSNDHGVYYKQQRLHASSAGGSVSVKNNLSRA